jgi:hypothetical protein
MKRLFLITCFLFIVCLGFGQVRPPSGSVLVQNSFYYFPSDSSLWQYLDRDLGFIRICGYKDLRRVTDSLFLLKQNVLNHPVIQADSVIKYVTPYQLIQSLPNGYELEVVTPGLTTVSVPFTLSNRTLVWYNGYILSKNLWSGVGTTSITLFIDTKQRDLLKIQNQ